MFIVAGCIVGIIVVIVVVVIFGGMIYQKVVQRTHCSIVDSESFSSKIVCLFVLLNKGKRNNSIVVQGFMRHHTIGVSHLGLLSLLLTDLSTLRIEQH